LLETRKQAENVKNKLTDTAPLESGLKAIRDCQNIRYLPVLTIKTTSDGDSVVQAAE
jgi:hypothetical protein